jgi:hypothetical protein
LQKNSQALEQFGARRLIAVNGGKKQGDSSTMAELEQLKLLAPIGLSNGEV